MKTTDSKLVSSNVQTEEAAFLGSKWQKSLLKIEQAINVTSDGKLYMVNPKWTKEEIKKLQDIVVEQYKIMVPDLDVQDVIERRTTWPLKLSPDFLQASQAFDGQRSRKECYRQWYQKADPSFKTGTWSDEEFEQLLEMKEEQKLKFTEISKLMHRSLYDCSKHIWNRNHPSEKPTKSTAKGEDESDTEESDDDESSNEEEPKTKSALGKRGRKEKDNSGSGGKNRRKK